MNNIVEGFGRYNDKEFIQFLDFYQSSVLEIMSMLYVLEDLEYITKEKIDLIRSEAEDTKNLTLALVRYLKSKDK